MSAPNPNPPRPIARAQDRRALASSPSVEWSLLGSREKIQPSGQTAPWQSRAGKDTEGVLGAEGEGKSEALPLGDAPTRSAAQWCRAQRAGAAWVAQHTPARGLASSPRLPLVPLPHGRGLTGACRALLRRLCAGAGRGVPEGSSEPRPLCQPAPHFQNRQVEAEEAPPRPAPLRAVGARVSKAAHPSSLTPRYPWPSYFRQVSQKD